MKVALLVCSMLFVSLSYAQDTTSVNQFWLGTSIGLIKSEDWNPTSNSYADANSTVTRLAFFEFRKEKKAVFFSGQIGFRSLKIDLSKRVYTYEFNDGDHSEYEGHYWNYEAEVFNGSLITDLNVRLPGKHRFQALFGIGVGVEKTLFQKIKKDEYVLFDHSAGHYYDPFAGQQVNYSHTNDKVYSAREQLGIPKSITRFAIRYFWRFQYRISRNHFIGADIRAIVFPKSIIGNLEGIKIHKGLEVGLSYGFGI